MKANGNRNEGEGSMKKGKVGLCVGLMLFITMNNKER